MRLGTEIEREAIFTTDGNALGEGINPQSLIAIFNYSRISDYL
jgi:hypothetical protein